ncbi:sulfite exporter TauE/SafE family protein [Microbacterium sp. HA-8]
MPELTGLAWVMLVAGALIIGLSKAALPGATTIAVALFAAVLPAKQSTGTILVLLIVGDLFALWAYRRHADIPALLKLAPAVVAGLLLGALFLALASDAGVRKTIAVILLVLVAITLWRRFVAARAVAGADAVVPAVAPTAGAPRRVTAAVYGALGGFTTMVANAGGPVMSMYFLAARFPVKAFLGTAAWFFATVNIIKLPFSIGLGLLTLPGLLIDLVLIPGVIIGAFAGRWIAGRISQRVFEWIVIALTIVGALYLLVL